MYNKNIYPYIRKLSKTCTELNKQSYNKIDANKKRKINNLS